MQYHFNLVKFLLTMKGDIRHNNWCIVQRRKNYVAITETPTSGIKKILLGLSTGDWYKGPEPDRSSKYHGHVWVFRKHIDNVKSIYIKIKLIHNKTFVKVLSFHKTD